MGNKSIAVKDMETRLNKVLNTIHDQYSAIDALFSPIDGRFSAIDGQVSAMESRINDRLSAMEAMLLKLSERQSSSTSPKFTVPQNEDEVYISPVVPNQEPLKEKLVENNNSSHTKLASAKRKTNDDCTRITTKCAKSMGDEFGKSEGTKISASSESIRKSNEAKKREEKKQVRTIELAENLVGLKIEVFWPEDGEYYMGVIDSYDPATKKHEVSYDDGDTEILLLEKEKWNVIEEHHSIVVKALEGFLVPLEVKSSDTISDVKAMIHSKQGMLPHLQRLILKTVLGFTELEDKKTIGYYSIENDSMVFLLDIIEKIHVDTVLGKFTLDAKRSDSIEDIKLKIYERVGMPFKEQVLTFNGNELGLEGGETLDDYICYNGCTLQLRRRLVN